MDPATKLVVLVAIHFTILFTAFTAFQTIITKLHEDQGDRSLGPFRFAINYSTFMVSNLFVSRIKYSEKWQITFATLTYAFHYLTGFFISGTSIYVKYITSILGAGVNGVGASFLWVAVGSYIHKVCHKYNKLENKGHYFGIFNTIFCISNVLGALVITFGLSYFSPNIYFILVSSVAFLAFFYGMFFIKDISAKQDEQLLKQSETLLQKKTVLESAKQSALSTLKFYSVMKYSLGLIFIDGINLGVTTSTMLHLMPTVEDHKENSFNAGICLLFYGVACIIGGFAGGKIADKLKIRMTSTLFLYLFSITCLYSILASLMKHMWMAILGCFLWGLVLFCISALLMVICSRLYGGRSQSFALVKQFHSFSFVIFEIVAMATNNSLRVEWIMFALLGLVIPGIWGVCRLPDQKMADESSLKEKNSILEEE